MVSEKMIIPQMQLLTYKETQFNVLQFVRKAASLSYKAPQEENDRMINRKGFIRMTARVSVSLTHTEETEHEEDTNTTNNPHINGDLFQHKTSTFSTRTLI